MNTIAARFRNVFSSLVDRYMRFTAPGPSGLPNWRVLVSLPLVVAIVLGVLVALGLSGTSSGAHWFALGSGTDPRLIDGVPRGIRSDEWLVQQSWVVSQYNQGFPAVNQSFPGGYDPTVLNDLPSWDWSSLFRPHLWGYLLFGLDVGVAWHWWFPAFGLLSACYVFFVTLFPRRMISGALLAGATFFTPFVQWWYMPNTLWSIAWPLLGMAAVVWVLRDERFRVRVAWGILTGYVAVTMAMGLYIPFMIPGVLVFFSFSVGYLLRAKTEYLPSLKVGLHRLLPLAIAGGGAVAIAAVYALSRLATFEGILSTVYPGQRFEATGSLTVKDPVLAGITGAPWNSALMRVGDQTLLGLNASEASSAFLLCAFVLPALLIFAARSLRIGAKPDWLLIACLLCLTFIGAYLLVPGWDSVAHVLQLDRVPPERFRIVFVLFIPVFAALVIDQVERASGRYQWALGLVSGVMTSGLIALSYWRLKTLDPSVLGAAANWKLISVLIVAGVALLFVRKFTGLAIVSLLVCSALTSWGVNPIYRGVFNLSETEAGTAITRIDGKSSGTWVGVGGYTIMAILVEAGVESYSGVQNYPATKMWHDIDPSSKYETEWNRLGHVRWSFAPGEPRVVNPQPDVIAATIDSCSDFAQKHVRYLLSDAPAESTGCLALKSSMQEGLVSMFIYEVVPKPAL